ncbi:MAG TPA: ABC transporter permease [Terriglobales bacterium]|nr:ABC transporter permease [Terriglobales bacterium]
MRAAFRIRSWAGALLRRRRMEREMDAELRFHIESYAEDLTRGGVPREEALRRARVEFGGLEQTKEQCRDARGITLVNSLLQDARYGLRMLGKSPGLTAIVVITLGLGIGVNSSIFSVVNAWLLRPLPIPHPEQIVDVASATGNSRLSYLDMLDLKAQADVFSDVFGYDTGSGGLSADGKPGQFAYSAVTGNYFSALRVKPLLGRLFVPGEGEQRGSPLNLVLGYAFWQKRFAGDPAVIGKHIAINGRPATIIGVTPRDFHGLLFAFDMDGYLPLSITALGEDGNSVWADRGDRSLMLFARMKPGTRLAQAQGSVEVVARRLAAQYPATDKGLGLLVIPERRARPAPRVSSFVPVIAALFLMLPGLVLLLACMNVANILLARAAAREREMAIRAAIGAGRRRLIRQMLTEGLLVALLGGAAGVVLGELAIAAAGALLRPVTTSSAGYAFRIDCRFDWKVFAYTLLAAVLTGTFVGLWPALRAGRADLNAVLHESGRGEPGNRHRLRSSLVVAQVAGSLMLLVVAGLLMRSLSHAEHMFLGFDPEHVLSVMLDPHQVGYNQARAKNFYRELERRVSALPGVESASLARTVPMAYPSQGSSIFVKGRQLPPDQKPPEISYNGVDPGYFPTMQVPLLRGRSFTDSDSETAPRVAIVNQTMAGRLWPNEDVLGKRFSLKSASGPWIEVVGVAADGQYWFISSDPQPYFYVPLAQDYGSLASVQARTNGPPEAMLRVVQREIQRLAPDMPIIQAATMQETVHGLAGLFIFQLAASLAGTLGAMGLLLAVVGTYGVVSFAAAQRTHEIGVRMALGATRSDILKLISRQGLMLVAGGLLAGLLAALGLTRAMSKLLMGVSPSDPFTYVAVVVLLAAVSFAACWIPARRSTRVDPTVALRYE